MKRRNFLKTSAGLATAAAFGPAFALNAAGSDDKRDNLRRPVPSPGQLNWQDCEVGVIYHFDLPIAAGIFAANNTYRSRLNPDLYQPGKLDTDQWIEAAKAAGAKYAIFTATHFNGFLQWQSDLYPYGLKQTSWRDGKGDVVADFVESCRKVGIQPGIYLSLHRNVYWELWGHYVDWGRGRGTAKQADFNRVGEKMTDELCSRYGPLVQIWYDAGVKTPEEGGPNVLPIFERRQPGSVFYHNKQRSDHRWVGNEVGYANDPCWATMPETPEGVSHNVAQWRSLLGSGDPKGRVWSPAMVDVPLRGANGVHNWFWAPGQGGNAHPAEALVEMYYKSVGRNSNFVIGEVVTPEGLVPESDIQRLREYGKEIQRRFGRPIAEISGEGTALTLELPELTPVDHIVVMEDISRGERIRELRLEGLADGSWIALGEAQSVGHKRILKLDRIEVSAIRLRIADAVAPPQIRRLAAYDASRA